MKESYIDKNEKWLAFRCMRYRNQVAEEVYIRAEDGVLCCGCGSDNIKQLTHDEIFGESWGARVPSPYYKGSEDKEGDECQLESLGHRFLKGLRGIIK
jgi:hypothetical protein